MDAYELSIESTSTTSIKEAVAEIGEMQVLLRNNELEEVADCFDRVLLKFQRKLNEKRGAFRALYDQQLIFMHYLITRVFSTFRVMCRSTRSVVGTHLLARVAGKVRAALALFDQRLPLPSSSPAKEKQNPQQQREKPQADAELYPALSERQLSSDCSWSEWIFAITVNRCRGEMRWPAAAETLIGWLSEKRGITMDMAHEMRRLLIAQGILVERANTMGMVAIGEAFSNNPIQLQLLLGMLNDDEFTLTKELVLLDPSCWTLLFRFHAMQGNLAQCIDALQSHISADIAICLMRMLCPRGIASIEKHASLVCSYPSRFTTLSPPCNQLFVEGNKENMSQWCHSLIHSFRSAYACMAAEKLAPLRRCFAHVDPVIVLMTAVRQAMAVRSGSNNQKLAQVAGVSDRLLPLLSTRLEEEPIDGCYFCEFMRSHGSGVKGESKDGTADDPSASPVNVVSPPKYDDHVDEANVPLFECLSEISLLVSEFAAQLRQLPNCRRFRLLCDVIQWSKFRPTATLLQQERNAGGGGSGRGGPGGRGMMGAFYRRRRSRSMSVPVIPSLQFESEL